jgi:hypothetical protein
MESLFSGMGKAWNAAYLKITQMLLTNLLLLVTRVARLRLAAVQQLNLKASMQGYYRRTSNSRCRMIIF